MKYGYYGNFLRIDLSTKTITKQEFSEETLRKYLGGSGLGTKILYDETDQHTDPLGPDNLLIFMTSPLVGTNVPNFGRYQVITRSPLTGSFGEANSGGTWGAKLRKAGVDGLIIKGQSEKPCYIYIEDGVAEIKDADDIWGKDTYELDDIMKEKHGKKTTIACIGPAGENLVLTSAVMNDGREGRAAARCGVGAVMGSKKLKAIAVNGNIRPALADEEGMRESIKKWAPAIKDATYDGLGKYGTAGGMSGVEAVGDLPIKNWSAGSFENVEKITGVALTEQILKKRYHCAQCVIGCGRTIEIKEGEGKYACVLGGGPEYETLGLMGSGCMIDDLSAISYANELCNRYGLDTIGAGNTVSFVMEAYEAGVITKEDLGFEAPFGNDEAMMKIIKMIAFREGKLGDMLAEGTKRAAEALGGIAPEFAVHVRGMDFPAHDPRMSDATGLQYATSTRGACHLNAFIHDFEAGGDFPGFGVVPPMKLERYSTEKYQSNLVKEMQDFCAICDTLNCCKFIIFGLGEATVDTFVEWVNMATGWDMTHEELMRAGERIFNLKRMYLVRDGQSRKDDVLPPKMTMRRGSGGSATNIPDVAGMLDDYYELRGWDQYGIPTKELLDRLDLTQEIK